ncbi:MAG: SDR family oxidoreductase [Angelakisella sp.]
MEKILQGKVALVTGGARGIGKSIVTKLAEYGADVIVNDLKIADDADVISEVQSFGVRAMALEGDITNCTAVEAMIDKAIEKMGRIDILVNNAGVYPALPVLEVTEKHFDFVVDVNLKGLFFMTQAVVKKSMLPNNYGRIVNISSCDGKNPGRGVAIYSAAKAGVISITKSFALELADYDINSNAVAAGWVESEQVLANDRWKDALPSIPSRRLGKLSEIAEAVVFMCNDKVSYINGEILDVNGGIIMD